tara:strand:+ start:112 stop:924 length:813 start_codon:yes stop_codon:yes gene_type:complete
MPFAHEVDYFSEQEEFEARQAAREKWLGIYANKIIEGEKKGRSAIDSMDQAVRWSKTMTPGENREYKWAFEGITNAPDWKKWGGGNKMGSGGRAVNAARKARADSKRQARQSAPDANVNAYTNKNFADRVGLTALSNFVDSRFNDTQGKNLPSNPSFGFSQQTLNAANARGADPSFAGEAGRNVYGGDMRSSYGNDSSSSFGSNFLSSYLNSPNLFRENPVEIASHDKPFSRYPAAGGPDKWPGMPSDAIKRYVHPSTNPITFFVNPYRV